MLVSGGRSGLDKTVNDVNSVVYGYAALSPLHFWRGDRRMMVSLAGTVSPPSRGDGKTIEVPILGV